MKKIKTINKLLSSLTLLSPLAGIGFNNQYQNTQKVITENSTSLNKYFFNQTNEEQRKMGDITVNVDGTTITGYVEGEGKLIVDSTITEIKENAFNGNNQINSINLSQATSLTSIGNSAFNSVSKTSLEGIYIPRNLSFIGTDAFKTWTFPSITVDKNNINFSLATNLGPNAKVLVNGKDGKWNDSSISMPGLSYGDIIIPSDLKRINDKAFYYQNINFCDFKNASSIEYIGDNAFESVPQIKNLDFSIMKKIQTIGFRAFAGIENFGDGVKLDFRNLENKLTIKTYIFDSSSKYYPTFIGDIVFPKNIDTITNIVRTNEKSEIPNVYFLSETPPSFDSDWILSERLGGKIYLPSESAKQAYLGAPNFGFSEEKTEIGLPPEPTPEPSPKKSNTWLILGLLIGLGLPLILVISFIIWYITKKKKTTVKI